MKKKILLPIFAAFMLFAGTDYNTVEASTSTKELTTAAYKYIGIPYVYGGTSTKGLDCSGFTQRVFKDLGITLKRTAAQQYTQGTSVSKSNLQTGDLVFFNTSGGVSHVGIFIGDGKFIHAGVSKGVSTASLNSSYWAPKYIGAKRITSFTNGKTVATVAKAEVKDAAIDFSIYASRGEVAIKLAKAMKLDLTDTNSPFPDVKSSSKYAAAATALYKAGVFTGDDKGKFNPNSPLTRAQMAKVLVVAFDLVNEGKAPTFKDVPVSHWSHPYVSTLASTGITVGKGDGTFSRDEYVTWKHLEAFIDRATR